MIREKKVWSLAVVAVVVVSLVPAGLANAGMITVVNPGFDFTTWNSATPGTTHTDSQGIIQSANDAGTVAFLPYGTGAGTDNQAQMLGWISGHSGGIADNSGGMWDGNGSSSDFQANNWPGNNAFGFVSGSGGSNIRNLISTPIANALQPNTTYTLSLTWYGNPWGNTTVPWSNILVDLTNSAGTALSTLYSASATPVAPTDNGPGSITYTVTTGPGQAVGDLKIYLGVQGSDGNHLFAFDNVQLSGSSTVPEPGSMALLAGELLSLAAYAWRKRR